MNWIKGLVGLGCLMIASVAPGQDLYRLPPQAIVDVVDAKPEPAVTFSPDGKWMLYLERNALPGIAELSRRWLGLAGMRIDPAADAPFRTDFTSGLLLQATGSDAPPRRIALPAGARLSNLSWSHRSNAFAFALSGEAGTELHWVRLDQGEPLGESPVRGRLPGLSTLGGFVDWHPDGDRLVCRIVPENRGAEPVANPVPSGPNIQESLGNTSPTRTFQDLLSSEHDERLFEFFMTTQLVELSLSGEVRKLGRPDLTTEATWSPDGKYLLVARFRRPFSRLMTAGSFPELVEVIDREGASVQTIVESPLAENIPIEGVPTWRRNIAWRPDQPASLVWVEALDDGDPRKEVAQREKVMNLAAPFSSEPTELCRLQHRFSGMGWTSAPVRCLVSDFDRDRRWLRTMVYDCSDWSRPPVVLVDRSIRDRYNDPGSPVVEPDQNGFPVVMQQDGAIWMTGSGASPEGDLPFLDRVDLATATSTRLWRCKPGVYEVVEGLLFDGSGHATGFVTSHEQPTQPPNFRLRDMSGGIQRELTAFADPTPQIRGIRKELVTYPRADGVQLSATMYLPPDWKEGDPPLPLLVWAYPVEFNDAATAGQITTSPARYIRIAGLSHLSLCLAGYAVMDSATMPVIGDPETMNDTFVEQIVGAAQAAIDKAVEMGVADRERVAVGGHSYGAFMTANLLAHCRLFRAGVARSGAYNRTLTPFGFQAERRPYWEAREVYQKVSPFTWADQIRDPLLLVHGEKDNNPGTFPVQSERMYQAIKGNGGVVRLVMLPHESHGYRARESVLHTHAETVDWLNRYVRDASPRTPPASDNPGTTPDSNR